MESVQFGDGGTAEQVSEAEYRLSHGLDKRPARIRERNAVQSSGERRAGVHPFLFSALKERAEGLPGRSALSLLLAPLCKQVDERADGRAAEAVAYEVDLLDFSVLVEISPVGDQRLVGVAVPLVVVPFRMDVAVVHGAALDVGIQVTSPVPHARERADGRCETWDAHLQHSHAGVAVPHAEQRKEVVDPLLGAPAQEPVNHDDRIVVGLFHFFSPL